MSTDSFTREYMPGLLARTEAQRRLYELAVKYERRCESFDQRVCIRRRDGVAVPVSYEEKLMVNCNAVQIFRDLMVEVESLGFTRKEFKDEIRTAQRHFDHKPSS